MKDSTAMSESQALAYAADLISQADALVVTAGAGMGVDSGLPDFRGTEGFWKAYPALGREQMDFHAIASPAAFRDWPHRAWGFYGHRLELYRQTQPHAGFVMLKCWGEQLPLGHAVFTSNVDGQFQKAGFDPGIIHECHGSIHHLQCLNACTPAIWPADGFVPEVDAAQCRLLSPLPRCPSCGALARPNILMFCDADWLEAREVRQAAKMKQWLSRIRRPVVVEIGAGTAIASVRRFGQRIVHEFGGRLVRINPRESTVPGSLDIGLASGSLQALTEIDRMLRCG